MDHDSRQAIVDLLFLALYQDDHLSIEEDGVLERALRALGWNEQEEAGPSVGAAFAAVREANSSDEKKEAFLQERASLLRGAGQAGVAFEWLGKVLGADGLMAPEERFLTRVQGLLFD